MSGINPLSQCRNWALPPTQTDPFQNLAREVAYRAGVSVHSAHADEVCPFGRVITEWGFN